MMAQKVTIVEVGPRDGFQPIAPFIATEAKIALIRRLHGAGIKRMEATAFVSPKAVPQMADAAQVLAASKTLDDLDIQVLVANARYAELAIAAGANHLSFVLSASDSHNKNNVRRTTQESLAEFVQVSTTLPAAIKVRLNVATAFDCPFEGTIPFDRVLAIVETVMNSSADAEIALCDTTGRATPQRVHRLCHELKRRFSGHAFAYHGHDTYGLGVANALAALEAGIEVIDASFGGLGGCPFAPGATGNVATEDVVWTLEQMGLKTGIALDRLLDVSIEGAALPGASAGGRVRAAMRGATACVGTVPA